MSDIDPDSGGTRTAMHWFRAIATLAAALGLGVMIGSFVGQPVVGEPGHETVAEVAVLVEAVPPDRIDASGPGDDGPAPWQVVLIGDEREPGGEATATWTGLPAADANTKTRVEFAVANLNRDDWTVDSGDGSPVVEAKKNGLSAVYDAEARTLTVSHGPSEQATGLLVIALIVFAALAVLVLAGLQRLEDRVTAAQSRRSLILSGLGSLFMVPSAVFAFAGITDVAWVAGRAHGFALGLWLNIGVVLWLYDTIVVYRRAHVRGRLREEP